MTFDIKAILAQLEQQYKAISIENIPLVLEATQSYLNDATERLTLLAEGNFETDYIKERLAEEGDIFKACLISYEVFGEMIAKDAQDKTVISIITTILTVLGQFLINKA